MKKRQKLSKSELLFNRMIVSTTRASLLIFLYLLWHDYEWTVDGMEQFIDGFWDYIEACGRGEDEEVNGLVNKFTVETGIDPGIFNQTTIKVNGETIRKNALMIAQLFLWAVADWEKDDLQVFGGMYWSKFEAYDKGEAELIAGIALMQKETGLAVKLRA